MTKYVKFMILVFLLFASFFTRAQLISGIYESAFGHIELGVEKNIVTGFYQYYGNYDPSVRSYLQQYIWFFYGIPQGDNKFELHTAESSFRDVIKGTLIFNSQTNSIHIITDDIPGTGAAFDIRQDGEHNVFPMLKSEAILGMGYAKTKKTFLYNYDGSIFTRRKGYLIAGDILSLMERKGGYLKVAIGPPWKTNTSVYWISANDFINADPTQWKSLGF